MDFNRIYNIIGGGEFGTGGCEYSFILITAFIAVAASDRKAHL
jgi:hypothetical protein